jgi:putative ABC transport system ATP-binding protein
VNTSGIKQTAAPAAGTAAREIVRLIDVEKDYLLGTVVVPALKKINLTIGRGAFMTVAGPSGSGKSTLLNIIGLIDQPKSGSVLVNGEDIKGKSDDAITDMRNKFIGFVFQSFNLVPVLNVYENIELPLCFGRKDISKPSRDWIRHLIKEVGLEKHQHHRPSELSGGQRQRVAIARALVCDPQLVLADEPTANLDSETGYMIIDLMRKLNHERGTTFIFSTHDHEIMKVADTVVRIKDGELQDG